MDSRKDLEIARNIIIREYNTFSREMILIPEVRKYYQITPNLN